MFYKKLRKEAVGNFRLKTGHDYMTEHPHNTGILPFSTCQICNPGIMNAEYLLICPKLYEMSHEHGDVSKFYRKARTHKNSL